MAYAAPEEPVAVVEITAKVVKPPSVEDRTNWVEETLEATADARAAMSLAEDYYYGKQRSQEELAELKKRGQPPTISNYIRRKVNTVRGEEIEKRVDPVVKPRKPKPSAEEEAKAFTDALRYVEEDQDIDGIGGDAMLDALVTGQFGAIVEVDQEDEYRCTVQHIPWNQLVVDHRSRKRDASDARFICNLQWFDLEDAIETYPDAEEALRSSCKNQVGHEDESTEDRPKRWFDGKRKRVKVCEMYYRAGKDWYRCDFTQGQDLRECAPSPYLDPRTKRPWCPIVVRRVYLDGENNAHGPVKDMISPQDSINKRESKSLHLLSVDQLHYEDGALLDPTAAHIQRAKPDGAVVYTAGALRDGRVKFERNLDLVQGQVAMLQEAKAALEAIGGAAANLPELPQSASGRAFLARQKSASREMGPVFEVFSSFRLAIYWHVFGCIKQYWPDEIWLRVNDDEAAVGYRWVSLNRRVTRAQRLQELLQKGVAFPEALQAAAGDDAQAIIQRVTAMHQAMLQRAQMFGQPPPPSDEQHMLQMVLQDEAMSVETIENNVSEAMVDITIHEAPESAVLEDEEFSKLAELMPTIMQLHPKLGPTLIRMLIRLSAFRDKREVLEEMDKAPDPQEQQLAQQQQQLQLAGIKAGVDVQATQAQLNAARAEVERLKAQQSGAKVPSEIQRNEAAAMRDAASAGSQMGGVRPSGAM